MRKFLTVLSIAIVAIMVVLAIPTFAVESDFTPITDYTHPELYTDASGNKLFTGQSVYFAGAKSICPTT